jgi:hypothetical protein
MRCALVAAARGERAGHNYLIQHSAGSGKTNSISWLSHRLASLHDAQDQKVFDCVVVITDRKVLDQQLQDAIYQIEHAQGVVKAIDQDSKQLADALIDGTKIVITTLQKFPFVLRGLLHAPAREQEKATAEEKAQAKAWEARSRRAAMRDRGRSAFQPDRRDRARAEGILGASGSNGAEEGRGRLGRSPEPGDGLARGKQPNLSFFAFTATPKGKTLELFGRQRTRADAGGVSPLQHAAGHRGGVHPRRADQLHDLRHLLQAAEGGRGRPESAEEEGGAGAGQVHEPAPAQHRAEDRGDGRALPPQRDAPARWARQGHGGHLVAIARGALQARLRALHRRERLSPMCARWSPSAAR